MSKQPPENPRRKSGRIKAKQRRLIALGIICLGVPMLLSGYYFYNQSRANESGRSPQSEGIRKSFAQLLERGTEQELLDELNSIDFGPELYLPLRLEAIGQRLKIADRLVEMEASPETINIAQRSKFFSLALKTGIALQLDSVDVELAEFSFFTESLRKNPEPSVNSLVATADWIGLVSRYVLAQPDSDLRRQFYEGVSAKMEGLRGDEKEFTELACIFAFVQLVHRKGPVEDSDPIAKNFIDYFQHYTEPKIVKLTELAQELIDSRSASSDAGLGDQLVSQINAAINDGEQINEARAKFWIVQATEAFSNNNFKTASASVAALYRIDGLQAFSPEFQQDLLRLKTRLSLIGRKFTIPGTEDVSGAAVDSLKDDEVQRIVLFISESSAAPSREKLIEIKNTFGTSLLGSNLQYILVLVHRDDQTVIKKEFIEFDRRVDFLDVLFLDVESSEYEQVQKTLMINEFPLWITLNGSTIEAINPTTIVLESMFIER